jgi:hypothetical protein
MQARITELTNKAFVGDTIDTEGINKRIDEEREKAAEERAESMAGGQWERRQAIKEIQIKKKIEAQEEEERLARIAEREQRRKEREQKRAQREKLRKDIKDGDL